MICDEQTCKYQTKMIRANRSCIDNECYGTMSEEVLNCICMWFFFL